MSDINVDNETGGEMTSNGRSPRFSLWIAFLVFSTITLGASVEIVSMCGAISFGPHLGALLVTR